MAMNQIQFQKGMSLPEFMGQFGTDEQCAAAIKLARWPQGFHCPRCDSPSHYLVGHGQRKLFQCNACRFQTSLTAGTLFASTKLPLTKWFLALYLISQAKTGLSALSMKRQLGVSYPTAWLMHHKIMHTMAQSEADRRLGGTVQLDDAYLGGERSGGTVGRGSENKVPFVAAVSIDEAGHPMHVKLSQVAGFTSLAIMAWAASHLMPGTTVTSDGLACFAAVTAVGCQHAPIVVGKRKPKDLPEFTWVNTVLGNLKTTLRGAHHSFKFNKYATGYFGAFCYRFNKRFSLRGLVSELIVDACRCAPCSTRAVRGNAEDHC